MKEGNERNEEKKARVRYKCIDVMMQTYIISVSVKWFFHSMTHHTDSLDTTPYPFVIRFVKTLVNH